MKRRLGFILSPRLLGNYGWRKPKGRVACNAVKFRIFTVISNIAWRKDLPKQMGGCEKSIWQHNNSIKLDRPLTMFRPALNRALRLRMFEVTGVSHSLNLRTLSIVRRLSSAILTSLFLFFFFLNCGNKLPEEIVVGEHKCEFCKMGVVNQNYHSQVLTKKGRRYHFDSIECLFSYWNKNSDKIEKVWVKNYQNPKEWIEIQNAKFLKADKLPSPMAANLSSYKTQKEAEDNRVLYGGVLMTQEEVMEYVKTNWEKELAGKR